MKSKELINKMNRVELYVQRNIKDYRIKKALALNMKMLLPILI